MLVQRDPYPELRAGGFTRHDGSIQFYLRIRALLEATTGGAVVLDFGAGRGAQLGDAALMHRMLMDLRPHAKSVIGVDVDEAVLRNPYVTKAYVVGPGKPLPLPDDSVDLIVADHVFEHLAEAEAAASELSRVLRAGGWICARTPNKWGYIALAAQAIPNRLHKRVLMQLQPTRQSRDVFPTLYRLNTPGAIADAFPQSRFDQIILGWTPEPAYGSSSSVLSVVLRLIGPLTPERFKPVLLIFLRLRSGPAPGHEPALGAEYRGTECVVPKAPSGANPG